MTLKCVAILWCLTQVFMIHKHIAIKSFCSAYSTHEIPTRLQGLDYCKCVSFFSPLGKPVNDQATPGINLVGFWSVYPEFTRINCVQQASISTWVSLSTFARWQHSYVLLLLARGDTVVPSGLYGRLCHAFLVVDSMSLPHLYCPQNSCHDFAGRGVTLNIFWVH